MKALYSPIEIPAKLPTDIFELQKQHVELLINYNKVLSELSWLKRQVFGQKTERFIPAEEQLTLDLQVEGTTLPVTTEQIKYERSIPVKKTEGHGRGAMPTHLPIEDVIIEPLEDVAGLSKIGEETSWEYEYEPGVLKIKRYRRPKYVRRGDLNDEIIIAKLPERAINKGNAGPGFIARVLVDKYVYHMPLDRQRKRYKTEYGVEIAESTFCDMIKIGGFWIEGIYLLHKKEILKATYLQADETHIPVLIKDLKGKTHKGYFWVYYDPLTKNVLFDYRKSRGRAGPSDILKYFIGILQIDGYEGYNEALSKEDVLRAACMAHVRRKFHDELLSDPVRAEYALKIIGIFFRRENMMKKVKMPVERRLSIRKKHIVPYMDKFQEWLENEYKQILPQSNIAKAMAYALNQWPYFTPYKTDGRVELSNNLVENIIRPITIGRKNYLFKGSHEAAGRAAMFYSLVETVKKRGLDPFTYFKDILTKLPDIKTINNEALYAFLPTVWKPK